MQAQTLTSETRSSGSTSQLSGSPDRTGCDRLRSLSSLFGRDPQPETARPGWRDRVAAFRSECTKQRLDS